MPKSVLSILAFMSVVAAWAQPYSGCQPEVGTVVFGAGDFPGVDSRIKSLFGEDQAGRKREVIDWETLERTDRERREVVMRYLEAGRITSAESFYYAAFIFQHGNCPEHYKLANRLAGRAVDLGYSEARWIFAATLDRYRLSQGKRQYFGTQYTSTDGCTYVLEPVDPATTDALRARFDVPSLAEAKAMAEEFSNPDECSPPD